MAYSEKYESRFLRGVEDPRPWDLIEEVGEVLKPSDKLLDIGCGTAYKLISLLSRYPAHEVVGLEPNEKMRKKAQENIKECGLSIKVMEGRAEDIPFEDGYFDVVTAMVAPHSTIEVYRVLKPKGHAIIEKISDRDKWNLKIPFGKDEKGLRGQFCYYKEGERANEFYEEFSNLFGRTEVRNGFWKTYYSLEGLMMLLEQTPTIRDFNPETDAHIVENIAEKYRTDKGIETTQNRLLIKAQK